MKRTMTVWLLMLAACCYCETTFTLTPQTQSLEFRITDLKVENEDIQLALLRIARDYRVPIGLEAALTRDKAPKISLKLSGRGRSLREVFDSLVEQDTRYSWKSSNGLYYFFQVKDREELLASILDTPVDQFLIEPKTDKLAVRSRIAKLPGVLAKLNSAGVSPLIIDVFSFGFDHEMAPDFSLSVENTTVKGLLDQIIKKSDVRLWVVNRFGERGQFFVLAM